MTSAIDPSLPADGVPASKAALRANLAAAKAEIEALQDAQATLADPPAYTVASSGVLQEVPRAVVTADSNVALTLTVPPGAGPGWSQTIIQAGTAQAIIAPGTGRTLRHPSGHDRTAARWATIEIRVIGNGNVVLAGATAAGSGSGGGTTLTGFYPFGSSHFNITSGDLNVADFHFQATPVDGTGYTKMARSPIQYRVADGVLVGNDAYIEIFIPDSMDWPDIYDDGNQAGLFLDGAANVDVAGLILDGCWDGLRCPRSYGSRIHDCAVFRSRDDVIEYDSALDVAGTAHYFSDILVVGGRQFISTRPGGGANPANDTHVYITRGIFISWKTFNTNVASQPSVGIFRKTRGGTRLTHHMDQVVIAYDDVPVQGASTRALAAPHDIVNDCTLVWLGDASVDPVAAFSLNNHPGAWTVLSGNAPISHLGLSGTSARDWLENYVAAYVQARPHLSWAKVQSWPNVPGVPAKLGFGSLVSGSGIPLAQPASVRDARSGAGRSGATVLRLRPRPGRG